MKSLQEGQLVTVAGEGAAVDGIVFQVPSFMKVVVAVPDSEHGAVFRTVHRKTLTERENAGADDDAMRRVIRQTPWSVRGGPRGGNGPGQGQRGHARSTMHRTTGK
jgi:hypothetical protein